MFQAAILKNETQLDHLPWLEACERKQDIIRYDVIDLTGNNWFENISGKEYDFFLLRPPGRIERYKRLYDERVFILSQTPGRKVYPSPAEIYIYENKRLLRDWLTANNIPHPQTFIFYSQKEADEFTKNAENYPIVGKTNIGASGNGVVFLNSSAELKNYIKQAFTTGIKTESGPKLFKGSVLKKIRKVFSNGLFLKQRLNDYALMAAEEQKGLVLLQEFIPHTFEWRCIRIGDSYFAHKKIAKNNKSSGTLIKEYGPVPGSLLDFIKRITDNSGLRSTSIDIFEKENEYLVNEVQCFFGQSDPYQMLVSGEPGRYRYLDNRWCFESGDFARNACFDLRLEHVISLMSK